MTPPKRRTGGGGHVGNASAAPRRSGATPGTDDPAHRPAPSKRTTPRTTPAVRWRPPWHKTLGFVILAAGVAVIVLNDVMLLQSSVTLLPFGHTELYLLGGASVAASATWWFGWFDRPR